MSENDVTFAADKGVDQQTASAETSQEVPEQEQEQQQPQYLTLKEAQRLLEEQKDEVLRQTQSLTDKASSRLDKKLRDELKKINDVISLQKEAGIPITPEQENAMRQKVYDKALQQFGEEEEPTTTAQEQPVDPRQMAEMAAAAVVSGMANDIYKEAGVTVKDNDPEAEMVDHSSPTAFLNSLRAAVEKKKQRVQTAPEARITTLGKGQSTNLEAQYLDEKKNIQGDVNALIELKKKYREKGLQV